MAKPQTPDTLEPTGDTVVPDAPGATMPSDPRIGTRKVTGEVLTWPEVDYQGRDYIKPVSIYKLPGRKDLFIVAPQHEALTPEILASFVPGQGS